MTGMANPALLGRWSLTPALTKELGATLIYEFTMGGDLIRSLSQPNGGYDRVFLTYRIEGSTIVTDQLSAPRELRFPFELTSDGHLRVGDIGQENSAPLEFVRNDAIFDPFAWPLAVGLFSTHHAIQEAKDSGDHEPFLIWDTPEGRTVEKLTGASAEQAEAYARAKTLSLHEAPICAFVTRGTLPSDATSKAMVATVNCRYLLDAIQVARQFNGVGMDTHATGGLRILGQHPSWLPPAMPASAPAP